MIDDTLPGTGTFAATGTLSVQPPRWVGSDDTLPGAGTLTGTCTLWVRADNDPYLTAHRWLLFGLA